MALVAVVLPHFLTRLLDHDRFAAWALMLQMAAYVNFLDFGLQTAIARYLAQAIERGDKEAQEKLLSTALLFLAIGALIAAFLLVIVCLTAARLFPQIPSNVISEFRTGVIVLGSTAALLLPFSMFTAVLIGLHRNELPALAIGGSRALGVTLVLFCVRHTHSLALLAVCIAATNLLGGICQLVMCRRLLPDIALSWSRTSRETGKKLVSYCGTLIVWSISFIMVTGLDLLIVGHADFARVGAYSTAALLPTLLAGINTAVCGALLTPIAVLQERGEVRVMQAIIRDATRITSILDFAIAIACTAWGYSLLRLWVGPVYASQATPILIILMFANAVRLVGNPLATSLMATGQQRYGLFAGLSEGVSNLIFSLIGVSLAGAIGVAWGTMCGAVISIVWIVSFVLPKVHAQNISRQDFVINGFLRPLVCLSPIAGYMILKTAAPGTASEHFLIVPVVLLCGLFTYFWGGFEKIRSRVGENLGR